MDASFEGRVCLLFLDLFDLDLNFSESLLGTYHVSCTIFEPVTLTVDLNFRKKLVWKILPTINQYLNIKFGM